MDQTTLKVALAGLVHDIGKFAQGSLRISKEYMENNAILYQPVRDGHYTHVHAVYTAAFIEEMSHLFPSECSLPKWGQGDSFINLAAGHHKPETPMQWIITTADWISSGLDRATFEKGKQIAIKDYKKTRLLPVLEGIGPERCEKFNSPDKFSYEYSLAPISSKTVFPVLKEEHGRKEAEQEYQKLFDNFVQDLSKLRHRDEDLELWMQHFDSLLMLYTSTIPAARVGDVVHDVSLYDHCRTTAALSAALYAYHAATNTLLEKNIKDQNLEKFLLIGGDFYGIQDFIFSSSGESRQFRSKLLRGRSFAVSLFSELATHLICERLKLPLLSVIMNAAGKFHILAPNLNETVQIVEECEREINDWLFDHSYGESSIGISFTKARPDEFSAGNFRALWDRHLQNVEKRKYRKVDLERHGGVVSNYLDSFNNKIQAGKRLCPLCGKRPSAIDTEDDPVFGQKEAISCLFCRDHVYLGGNLVKARQVAICSAEQESSSGERKGLIAPIFGHYQVYFRNDVRDTHVSGRKLLALWQIDINEDGTIPVGATVKLINGHVPWYREEDNADECLLESAKSERKLEEMISQIRDGGVKTFGHIALKARHKDGSNGKCRGIEALGVLKADVDNLGMLFGCGLTKDRFTISRLATLSRQLNNFFSLYLPHLLRTDYRFFNVYTVFAGGDDLFLIGPWNRMAELAVVLQERFEHFVCHNPDVTFSAGITVHKPNTPVDYMAEASEDALKESKRKGRNRVSMFGQTIRWDDFKGLLSLQDDMKTWIRKDYISDVMFYKLNHFVEMAERETALMEKKFISVDELSCVKWPALFKYNLVRNITKNRDIRDEALKDVGKAFDWIKLHKGGVRIPLWHVLYEKRK